MQPPVAEGEFPLGALVGIGHGEAAEVLSDLWGRGAQNMKIDAYIGRLRVR